MPSNIYPRVLEGRCDGRFESCIAYPEGSAKKEEERR
jgi:hypothetical protein